MHIWIKFAIKAKATAWKWIFGIAVSERTENEINIKQCVTFFAKKQRYKKTKNTNKKESVERVRGYVAQTTAPR